MIFKPGDRVKRTSMFSTDSYLEFLDHGDRNEIYTVRKVKDHVYPSRQSLYFDLPSEEGCYTAFSGSYFQKVMPAININTKTL